MDKSKPKNTYDEAHKRALNFLRKCEEMDIILTCTGKELDVFAPKGVMTDALRVELEENEPVLIKILSDFFDALPPPKLNFWGMVPCNYRGDKREGPFQTVFCRALFESIEDATLLDGHLTKDECRNRQKEGWEPCVDCDMNVKNEKKQERVFPVDPEACAWHRSKRDSMCFFCLHGPNSPFRESRRDRSRIYNPDEPPYREAVRGIIEFIDEDVE